MFRVLLPDGSVVHCTKVFSLVEEEIEFNGEKYIITSQTKTLEGNTSMLTYEMFFEVHFGRCFKLGNLSNQALQVYLTCIMKEGYLDLSALSYQNSDFRPTSPIEVAIDAGKSLPYLDLSLNGILKNFASIQHLGYMKGLSEDTELKGVYPYLKVNEIPEEKEEE